MNRHRAEVRSARSTTLLNASAVMAFGTIVSRITGFMRSGLIAIALSVGLNADIYTVSNTIPTAMYILVAGGVFNVVLVPQLVRAMKNDSDGGDAYANRVITLGLLVLGATVVLLIIFTPLLARLTFSENLFTSDFTAERESAYNLMRYCLPQVFFYGAFVLVGQILNARGRFGPMMWAPIINNIVSIAIMFAYIAVYGTAERNAAGGFSTAQELVLGVGSTIGIALQALILLPYLRRTGFRIRLRFDFRGVGLGHTLRLGLWTLMFVIVNQIAYMVINRLASESSTDAKLEGGDAAGATVYQIAYLISQVPHGIITVSVLTATIPLLSSLAADRDFGQMRTELQGSMRIVLAAIVPIAVAVGCLGQSIATIMTSYGSLKGGTGVIGLTMMAFAPGIVFFSLHYMLLRGFYANEDTRTPFMVQIWVSGTNIILALLFTEYADTDQVAMFLALAYGGSYFVGSMVSSALLSRRAGRVFDHEMIRYVVRLVIASGIAGAVMYTVSTTLHDRGFDGDSVPQAIGVFAGAGFLGIATYLIVARLLRIKEVTSLIRTITRRS